MKSFNQVFYLIVGLIVLLEILSCNKEGSTSDESTSGRKADFELIQQDILTTTCAVSGCHASSSDASYAQHKLVLKEGQAWDNLIGKTPQNLNAKTAGLKLVQAGNADMSLLYHKITCEVNHHSNLGNLGSPMPLGGEVLSIGQVEFIKRWINTGASKTSAVVDVNLLKDLTPCQISMQPLAAPAIGSGFQLGIPTFDIPKNSEREVFYRVNTTNTDTVFVNRIQMRGANNSHHFVAYSFRNLNQLPAAKTLRDLRIPNTNITNPLTLIEMQNHIFLAGGTDVNSDVTLPDGVALKLSPSTPIDLNAHYFNRTNLTLTGQNYINFYTVPKTTVRNEAKTLDLNNLDIDIPANTKMTFTKNFIFNSTTNVVMLTSHFHRLGEKFVIKIYGGPRNGEILYTNTDWEHPLVVSYPTAIVLKPGEGLTSEVTYNNTTSSRVVFGFTSQDEMNIIFGYYY